MLKEKLEWRYFWLRSLGRYAKFRITHKSSSGKYYCGKKLLNAEECNEWIAKRIEDAVPTAVTRFGAIEMNIIRKVGYGRLYFKKHRNFEAAREQFRIGPGFFSNDMDSINKFYDLILELLPETDLLAEWNLPMEEYYISKYMKSIKLTWLSYLEPWAVERPWSAALKGKKVVVVHPFADSILQQYSHRELIWDNEDILPEFELRVVKAVQTIAGEVDERFVNWFEALDYMYKEIIKEDFDVAIIGCGAYGMPLSLKVKQYGKIAIHLGGCTQLLFGIKGKRWEGFSFYNENWISPRESERPKNLNSVEDGCYW